MSFNISCRLGSTAAASGGTQRVPAAEPRSNRGLLVQASNWPSRLLPRSVVATTLSCWSKEMMQKMLE